MEAVSLPITVLRRTGAVLMMNLALEPTVFWAVRTGSTNDRFESGRAAGLLRQDYSSTGTSQLDKN